MSERLLLATRAAWRLMRELVLDDVAIVHLHAAMKGSFWRKAFYSFMARLFGVPTVLHLHGSETKQFFSGLSFVGRVVVRWTLSGQSAVIVLSESWAEFIRNFCPAAKVFVVPNYVDVQERTADLKVKDEVEVLFLGALGQRKGIYDLIRALHASLLTGRRLRLLIGGDGEVENVRTLSEELKISAQVTLLGWIDRTTREALLSQVDVFVLPSYNEGLPMSVLEAMAFGIPVITSPVGGIPELITDGVNGLLVPPGSITDLSNALNKLYDSNALRVELGTQGRCRLAETYSRDSSTLRLLNVYEHALTLPH